MNEPKKCKFHMTKYKAKVALEALRSGKTINQIGMPFRFCLSTLGSILIQDRTGGLVRDCP
jgi:hypothetical protein